MWVGNYCIIITYQVCKIMMSICRAVLPGRLWCMMSVQLILKVSPPLTVSVWYWPLWRKWANAHSYCKVCEVELKMQAQNCFGKFIPWSCVCTHVINTFERIQVG